MKDNPASLSGRTLYQAFIYTRWWQWLLISFSLCSYLWLAYFIPRTATFELLLCYGILFLAYLVLYQSADSKQVCLFLGIAIFFRLFWLPAMPALSDDFYRFIWDGKLLAHHFNPFAATPQELWQAGKLEQYDLSAELYQNLNSPQYYTIYPPLNQFIFWLAVKVSPDSWQGSVILMRLFILMSELGTLVLLPKMLKLNNLQPKLSLLYALNPLIVIELTGNLHFEGMMIFFLLLTIFFWQKQKIFTSGVTIALSIASKLIPLMLLPLWWRRLSIKKLFLFYVSVVLICIVLFSFLLDADFIQGMQSSLGLYFSKFEFNASFYYLVREIGYWIKGYNVIQSVGKYLALAVVLFIGIMSWWQHYRKLTLWQAILWVWFFYLMVATTVHPWYVTPLIAITIFTRFRFAILWSFLIFFTYTNYQSQEFTENLWVVLAEYLLLIIFLLVELFKFRLNPQIGRGSF